MANSQPVARNVPKRDPVKMKLGRAAFVHAMENRSISGLDREQVESAIYYLDAQLFLPTGGKKVKRMLRARGKELNVL